MANKVSRRSFLKSLGVAAAAAGVGVSGLGHATRTFARGSRFADLPRLLYIFPGSPQPDVAKVQEAMSAYMAERIGATIELRAVDWGAYNDQIGLINAAGEKHDIAFTAPWINNYYANISQDYLAPLEDKLPTLAPNYWASMTPATWEAARVGKSIYGGINQQIFVKPFGPTFRADVVQTLGLADAINAVKTYEDLDPIFKTIYDYVQKDDKLTYLSYGFGGVTVREIWGYDPVDEVLAVKIDDADAKVVIFTETDEFRRAAELIRKWYQAGYMPADQATWNQADDAWKAGLYVTRVAEVQAPGGEAAQKARWGMDVFVKAIAEPFLTTGSVTATLNGVASVSDHQDLAVKFLELVNSDPVFYNLLCKGIEGTHWEWADKSTQLIKPAGGKAGFGDTGYAPNTDWMFGNVFNSYYVDPTQVGAWPATAELNRNARPSPVLGFTFDRKTVETETAAISAAKKEFEDPLGGGIVDVAEGIAKLNEALRKAGIEKVRDEMQRQIEAWKAAQS